MLLPLIVIELMIAGVISSVTFFVVVSMFAPLPVNVTDTLPTFIRVVEAIV